MNIPLKAGARLKAALVGAGFAAGAVGCGGGGDPAGSNGQPMPANQFMATTQVSISAQAVAMPANRPPSGR